MSAGPAHDCASLAAVGRGMAFLAVGKQGKLRRKALPNGESRWVLDFRPVGQVYSIPTELGPIPLADEGTARRVLEAIRARLADGVPIEAALASFKQTSTLHVLPRATAWLEHLAQREAVGLISPNSLVETRSEVKCHWQRWSGVPVHAITGAELDTWALELAAKDLAPNTRRRILGSFHAFLRWIERRREIAYVPTFPTVTIPERVPTLLSPEQQDAALETIPEAQRGLFLAMVDLAIRPGEARPLRASAVEIVAPRGPEDPPAWVRISDGAKGAKVAGTKTGRERRLPATERLTAWIVAHVTPEARLRGDLLFPSPLGGMYAHGTLARRWQRACRAAGVPFVPLRQASRHSTATDLLRKGASLEEIRRLLGHTNARMSERYARWSDQALVAVMRPRGKGKPER